MLQLLMLMYKKNAIALLYKNYERQMFTKKIDLTVPLELPPS